MRRHGREPDGAFDEPFMMLRNQGQILGEERAGDRIVVDGEFEEGRLLATTVRVDPDAAGEAGQVVGEIMRRTENVLHVETAGGPVLVEVAASATVEIPSIPGTNDVGQLRHHLDVQRMSKSRGNVVNPDEFVQRYGADTMRTYLMFAFEWAKGGPWDSRGILGARRFIEDVWKLGTADYVPDPAVGAEERAARDAELQRRLHQTIQKVDADMLDFKWNTAVAALMSFRSVLTHDLNVRAVVSADVWAESVDTLLELLAPIAPHVTEEVWHLRGHATSIHLEAWPVADPELAAEETVTMVVQVNGKVRDRVEVPADVDETTARQMALAAERVQSWLADGEVRNVVVRPPNLVNIVVG
jgi:leucyl-tRNA synthetase